MGVQGGRRKGRGSLESKYGASHCKQWGLCGVILCREGWRRGSSQLTLGFLVWLGLIGALQTSFAFVFVFLQRSSG